MIFRKQISALENNRELRIAVFLTVVVLWILAFIPFVWYKNITTITDMVMASVALASYMVWLCIFDFKETERNIINRYNNN
jgi:hypothetical protein